MQKIYRPKRLACTKYPQFKKFQGYHKTFGRKIYLYYTSGALYFTLGYTHYYSQSNIYRVIPLPFKKV